MKISLFIFSLFFLSIKINAQNNTSQKFKITLGFNSQISLNKVSKYYSYGNLNYDYLDKIDYGCNFLSELNFQNRFLLSGINAGFMFEPLSPGFGFNSSFKNAFNINFKDKSLQTFFGPTVSFGSIFINPKNWELNPSELLFAKIGFLYSKKLFNVEFGQYFRKRNYEGVFYNRFKYGFYVSVGFRIPLKKEPKN